MVQYIYDAEDRRVAKGTIHAVLVNGQPTLSCDTTQNGFTLTNSYGLDLAGEQVTETGGDGQWLHTNVFVGGQLLATYDPNGIHSNITDWLGTRRVQANSHGEVEETYQNLPFGELVPQNNTFFLGATEHHFTGKERDTESGNDYMFARYYNSATGRFLSPDWSVKVQPVPYAKLDDPQSLNLYDYVRNNPLSRTDPDGHDWDKFKKYLGAAVTQLTTRVTFGIGIGEALKLPVKAASGRAEIAGKESLQFSNGKLSNVVSANAGVSFGLKNTKVGLEKSIEKVTGSVNTVTGEKSGAEPATRDDVPGIKTGNATTSGSGGGYTIGTESGEGFLAGGQISITKEGVGDLKAAWGELKDSLGLTPPAPPPAPAAPSPPPN